MGGYIDPAGYWHPGPETDGTSIGMHCPNCGRAVSSLFIIEGATFCGYCKPKVSLEQEIAELKRRIEQLEIGNLRYG